MLPSMHQHVLLQNEGKQVYREQVIGSGTGQNVRCCLSFAFELLSRSKGMQHKEAMAQLGMHSVNFAKHLITVRKGGKIGRSRQACCQSWQDSLLVLKSALPVSPATRPANHSAQPRQQSAPVVRVPDLTCTSRHLSIFHQQQHVNLVNGRLIAIEAVVY